MGQQTAGDEAEADQPEEGQREIENLSQARFQPPEKNQRRECGGRAEKRRELGKAGQKTSFSAGGRRSLTRAFRRTSSGIR
ncbi:MAG: hypothetical protein QOF41_3369 [Methylobacteriaceae bacterium]|jgi:hypothetical protein|nr:hypothetical protein [Methylobacteriaceae bacterium]